MRDKVEITIVYAIAVTIFIAVLVLYHVIYTTDGTIERLFDERFDLPHGWFAYAHQYHGCFHSYWSEQRNAWVFVRDGKECLLFTESLRNVILDRFRVNEEQRKWLEER